MPPTGLETLTSVLPSGTAGNATWCKDHKQQSKGCLVVLYNPTTGTFRPCGEPKRPGTTSCCAHQDLNRHPPDFEARGDKPPVRRDKPYTPAAGAAADAAAAAGLTPGLVTPGQQASRVQGGDYRSGRCCLVDTIHSVYTVCTTAV